MLDRALTALGLFYRRAVRRLLAQHRRYRSGMLCAAWRWTDVVLAGDLYLRRLHVARAEFKRASGGLLGGAVMLHKFYRPDPQPDLHDHPVSFLSIVLRGGYLEERGPERALHKVNWLNWIPATAVHRIIYVKPGTITLALAGPKVREWGFHTPSGWVGWRDYDHTKLPQHV